MTLMPLFNAVNTIASIPMNVRQVLQGSFHNNNAVLSLEMTLYAVSVMVLQITQQQTQKKHHLYFISITQHIN